MLHFCMWRGVAQHGGGALRCFVGAALLLSFSLLCFLSSHPLLSSLSLLPFSWHGWHAFYKQPLSSGILSVVSMPVSYVSFFEHLLLLMTGCSVLAWGVLSPCHPPLAFSLLVVLVCLFYIDIHNTCPYTDDMDSWKEGRRYLPKNKSMRTRWRNWNIGSGGLGLCLFGMAHGMHLAVAINAADGRQPLLLSYHTPSPSIHSQKPSLIHPSSPLLSSHSPLQDPLHSPNGTIGTDKGDDNIFLSFENILKTKDISSHYSLK